MSHGFIDDIPGHTEFWRRFRTGQFYDDLWNRTRIRFGLLKRLIYWKCKIRKLRKCFPNSSLRELTNRLVCYESKAIIRAIENRV